MKVIGRGMVAHGFTPYAETLPDVVIFASGVSDSTCTDLKAYARERHLLYNTLQTCHNNRQRIVYFSSGGAIYGHTDALRHEDTPTYPATDYGRHQLFCESVIINSGVPYLIVRLPNLVGPSHNTAQLIPALVQQARSGHARLFQRATRDLIDITDMAALTVRLLQTHTTNQLVTIASGISTPAIDLFAHIQAVLGTQAEVTLLDKGDQQRFSISKLCQLVDIVPPFPSDYHERLIRKYASEIE